MQLSCNVAYPAIRYRLEARVVRVARSADHSHAHDVRQQQLQILVACHVTFSPTRKGPRYDLIKVYCFGAGIHT